MRENGGVREGGKEGKAGRGISTPQSFLKVGAYVSRRCLLFIGQILLKLEEALRHQIRHEYNKTGRHSNVTNIKVDHVTIVLDLIQVKV